MTQKMKQQTKAQIVFEYIIIFAIAIVALAGSKFIQKIKASFNNHFNQCVEVITTER